MLQFLICRRRWDEQAFTVASSQTAYDARAGDGAMADGYDILEFGFEDGVEGLTATDCDEGEGVCEGTEYADFIAVLEGRERKELANVVTDTVWRRLLQSFL